MVLYHTITEFATVSQLSKGLPKHHPTLMSLDNLPLNIFTSPCSELQVKSSTLRLDYDEEGLGKWVLSFLRRRFKVVAAGFAAN